MYRFENSINEISYGQINSISTIMDALDKHMPETNALFKIGKEKLNGFIQSTPLDLYKDGVVEEHGEYFDLDE